MAERILVEQKKAGVGRAAGAAAKGTFKLIAFLLNFFVPGLGTFFVGRIGTAIVQLILLVVGLVSLAFGGIGFVILIADWVWGMVTVLQAWRKPDVVYVVSEPSSGPR